MKIARDILYIFHSKQDKDIWLGSDLPIVAADVFSLKNHLTVIFDFQPIPQWPQQSGPSQSQTFHPNQSFAPNFGQNSKNKNTQQSDQNVSQGAFAPIFGQNKFNKNKKGAQTSQKRPNANPDDPSAPKKPKAKPKILTDIDIPR